MDKITYTKLAFMNRFMKESNAYGKYRLNCTKPIRWVNYRGVYYFGNTQEKLDDNANIEVVFKYLNLGQMLQYAFDWESAVEGRIFWATINENYLESLKMYKSIRMYNGV